MDRRDFLISTGGVAAVAASATVGAVPSAAHDLPAPAVIASGRLRLAMAWADSGQGPGDSARRLVQRFESMTGGRFRVEVAAHGAEPGADADLVHGTAHDFAGQHAAFAYFAGLPGNAGLTAQEFSQWLTVGGGQMLWDDLAAGHGFKPLLAGHSGDAPPLWSRQPVDSLASLARARVHAPGLGSDVARALGAEPHPIASRDAAAALAAGELDAAEVGGLLTSMALGVARGARYATGSGLNGQGTAHAVHVRLGLWTSLSDADKAILTAAATEEFHASVAEANAHQRIARQALEGTFGVRFAAWPNDVAEALSRVSEATIAHLAGQDETAARIDQSYMAFRRALSGVALPRRGATPVA